MSCKYEIKKLQQLEDENLEQRMYIAKLESVIKNKFESEVNYLRDQNIYLEKENKRLKDELNDLKQDNQFKTYFLENCEYFEVKKLEYQRKYNKCRKALEEIIKLINITPKEFDTNTKFYDNQKTIYNIEAKAKSTLASVDNEDF